MKIYSLPFYLVYNEGDGANTGGGDSANTGANTEGANTEGANTGAGTGNNTEKKFTQEDLNRFLAEDRKKHQAQVQKHVSELENLKKSQNLTEKERTNLQAKIDELNNSMLTKEQLAQKEREKMAKEHQTQVQTLTEDRDGWKNRYVKSTIDTAIVGEAVRAEAFDPDALIAILGPNTRLVEEKDEEGNSLNIFTPKVKFNDVDKDGKQVTLDLTVPEVVKRMKDIQKYGYLFKSTATGGLGSNSGAGGSQGKFDISKMTVSQYREARNKGLIIK